MRWYAVSVLFAIMACASDDGTGLRPSERYEGLLTLESVHGEPLPLEVITPSEHLERRSTTIDVTAEHYLPRGLWVDSLVKVEDVQGTNIINRTQRDTLIGFVRGDTILFRAPDDDGFQFIFVFDDPGTPVRLNPDRSPADEVWTKR